MSRFRSNCCSGMETIFAFFFKEGFLLLYTLLSLPGSLVYVCVLTVRWILFWINEKNYKKIVNFINTVPILIS